MITSFKSLGQGGSSPSTLPIATTATTGVVKIGDGINIDSAGTISVNTVDPSTIKSVSALPQTAVAGDVVSYNGEMWKWKTESGTTTSISNWFSVGSRVCKDALAWYGELPTNQILFYFNWDDEYYYYFSYNNNVISVWRDTEMTDLADTFNMNGTFSLEDNIFTGTCIDGLFKIAAIVPGIIGIQGNWNVKSTAHWEPFDWEYRKNYVINEGIEPDIIPGTDFIVDRNGYGQAFTLQNTETIGDGKFGITPFHLIGIKTDYSTYATADVSLLPYSYTGTVMNYYVNGYICGVGQDSPNVYSYGVLDGDYQWKTSGTTSGDGTYSFGSGEDWEGSVVVSGNSITISFTNINYNDATAPGFPIPCVQFEDVKYPIPFRR